MSIIVRDPNSGKKSIAKANFLKKKIAKRKRSERQIIFCEAKRSEFASLSLFFAIKRIRNANLPPWFINKVDLLLLDSS